MVIEQIDSMYLPKTPVKQISHCPLYSVTLGLDSLARLTVLLIVLLVRLRVLLSGSRLLSSSSIRVSHRSAPCHLSTDSLLPHNTNKGVIVVRDSAVWTRTDYSN